MYMELAQEIVHSTGSLDTIAIERQFEAIKKLCDPHFNPETLGPVRMAFLSPDAASTSGQPTGDDNSHLKTSQNLTKQR